MAVARKILPLLFVVALAGPFCRWLVASIGKPLWADELITVALVKTASFPHLLAAVLLGLDATPPLYTGYGWLILHHVFQETPPRAAASPDQCCAGWGDIMDLVSVDQVLFRPSDRAYDDRRVRSSRNVAAEISYPRSADLRSPGGFCDAFGLFWPPRPCSAYSGHADRRDAGLLLAREQPYIWHHLCRQHR